MKRKGLRTFKNKVRIIKKKVYPVRRVEDKDFSSKNEIDVHHIVQSHLANG